MIYGQGINDADYVVCPTINDKQIWCPYYQVWYSMLSRCYSEKYHKLQPTYMDCEVCTEWKLFSKFRLWMETQDWKGKQLDKDILGDKLYSSETCCFVPGWLNNLFLDRGRERGKYPIGVCKYRNKFQALIRINGKRKHLGLFSTSEEAHSVYLKAKKEHVHTKMKDYPDQRVKEAVLKKIMEATHLAKNAA